jgi:hypothetical protein
VSNRQKLESQLQENISVQKVRFVPDPLLGIMLIVGILHVIGRCKDLQGEWAVIVAADVGGGK